MFEWARFLGFRAKRSEDAARRTADSRVRVLAITADDAFYADLVDLGASREWEVHRAGALHNGIELAQSLLIPLVILDCGGSSRNWRREMSRICDTPPHPCVLLASRVVDDNLRQEVLRHRGYDIYPRTGNREQAARVIEFAWFWATRSRTLTDSGKQQEARP